MSAPSPSILDAMEKGEKGKGKSQAAASERAMDIMSCAAYALTSILMILVNKFILSTYSFSFDLSLIFFQNFCAFICVYFLYLSGKVKVEKFELKIAYQWIPLNIIFVSMLLTGTLSLKHLSVPILTVFKNLAIVLTYFGEMLLFNQPYQGSILLSLFVMIFGFLYAATEDLQFNLLGYFWAAVNILLATGNVLYSRTLSKDLKLSSFGSALYNNLLSLPLLLVVMVFQNELPAVFSAPQLGDGTFLFLMLISGILGFAISLSSFWCISRTSSTTYSMVGALNKIPLSVLGVLIFHTKMTIGGYVATFFALAGGVMYFAAKANLFVCKILERKKSEKI